MRYLMQEDEGETAHDVAKRLANIPWSFKNNAVQDFRNMAQGDTDMAGYYPHVQDLRAFAREVLRLMGDK